MSDPTLAALLRGLPASPSPEELLAALRGLDPAFVRGLADRAVFGARSYTRLALARGEHAEARLLA